MTIVKKYKEYMEWKHEFKDTMEQYIDKHF